MNTNPKIFSPYIIYGRDILFDRTARLTGPQALERMRKAKIIIFGCGGVGSWTAETLARTGFADITLVDADNIVPSNINRQLPALNSTIGRSKVDALRQRLLDISPGAHIEAIQSLYTADTADKFHLEQYDYIFDAIDSLSDKALLILRATAAMASTPTVKFYSSMGAALKLDPSRIAVAEFWKVKGCPLAAALRRKFKKSETFPAKKFKCVYSDELIDAHPDYHSTDESDGSMTYNKVATNGSLMHITAIFGITLASLAIRDIMK